jgi:hypothetical protein
MMDYMINITYREFLIHKATLFGRYYEYTGYFGRRRIHNAATICPNSLAWFLFKYGVANDL